MKCELCKQKDAETAIAVVRGGVDDELYVCGECARRERIRRQKKSQRTRKASGLPPGVSLSVTQIGGDGETPPPIVEAIMNAMNDVVSGIESAARAAAAEKPAEEVRTKDYLPGARVDRAYRVAGRLHLEGLYLIGEIDAVRRALNALGLELRGVDADGVRDAGHAYSVGYSCPVERVRRIVRDILAQERNARERLLSEMPRVLADSVCRALAMLKNCRLLSPAEEFDLLSPIRLAAREGLLDGVSDAAVEEMMGSLDLASKEDSLGQDERDRCDADRADEMNALFEDVVLSDRAEEIFR